MLRGRMRLPVELLVPIVEILHVYRHYKALTHVVRVSSAFNELATPYLYHTVHLWHSGDVSSFRKTLAARPSLRLHVRFVAIPGDVGRHLGEAVSDVLRSCTNLDTVLLLRWRPRSDTLFTHTLATTSVLFLATGSPTPGARIFCPGPLHVIAPVLALPSLAMRLEQLHITCSLTSDARGGWHIRHHSNLEHLRVRKLSLTLKINQDMTGVDPCHRESLAPFMQLLLRALPHLERLRIFFCSPTALQAHRYIRALDGLSDARITIAVLDRYDAEMLVERHAHGEIDMWDYGEALVGA